mmetsp:Transcript_57390/g.153414  ORF Transcript_57390/g.153414 Transcript_57390/m.153414 type:complete len:215 (+) Transcript_57390:1350-1994(+)
MPVSDRRFAICQRAPRRSVLPRLLGLRRGRCPSTFIRGMNLVIVVKRSRWEQKTQVPQRNRKAASRVLQRITTKADALWNGLATSQPSETCYFRIGRTTCWMLCSGMHGFNPAGSLISSAPCSTDSARTQLTSPPLERASCCTQQPLMDSSTTAGKPRSSPTTQRASARRRCGARRSTRSALGPEQPPAKQCCATPWPAARRLTTVFLCTYYSA